LLYDPIAEDPPTTDRQFPATMAELTIDSHGAALNAVVLIAQGRGPHPTVLLLHGFPGNERNFDLAQALRRAGWNVMVFHYRGNWGSEGDYAFGHVLQDTQVALDQLRSEAWQRDYRVDSERVVLIGHSLGGFAALHVAAGDPQVRAVGSISGCDMAVLARESRQGCGGMMESLCSEALSRLHGTTAQHLIDELVAHEAEWALPSLAPRLADRQVLLVAAARDEALPVEEHHTPLVEALRAAGAQHVTTAVLGTDHCYADRRVSLARTVLAWLRKVDWPTDCPDSQMAG
jgi:dipeptidyl aminopeptidase/acylaminoacyl peptidase